MMQWIAAGDGINMNYRFSQPGRTERNRQDQLYAEGVFPFANQTTTDPITGKTAGRYDACTKTNTCPLAMEIYSAERILGEGQRRSSTRTRRARSTCRIIRMARLYLISEPSARHRQRERQGRLPAARQSARFGAGTARAVGSARPMVDQGRRAAAEQRSASGRRHARAALPQSAVGFPKIPGVTYTGLKSTRLLLNYGPDFYATGIMTHQPAGDHAADVRQPEERADLSDLCAEDRMRTATTSPASACPM